MGSRLRRGSICVRVLVCLVCVCGLVVRRVVPEWMLLFPWGVAWRGRATGGMIRFVSLFHIQREARGIEVFIHSFCILHLAAARGGGRAVASG